MSLTIMQVNPFPHSCSFWTKLGTYMTKLDPDQTKIHLIGNNVTGNKKGENLMKFLSKAINPSKVTVESPLELGQAGKGVMQFINHAMAFTFT